MFWRILNRLYRLGDAASGPPSLAFVLAVSITAASFLLVAITAGLLYFGLASNLRQLSEEIMRDELAVCRALIQARSTDSHELREEVEIDSAVRRYQKFYIRVLDEQGNAVFTTPGMNREMTASDVTGEWNRHQGQIFWLEAPSGKAYRVVVERVRHGSNPNEFWTIQLALDLSQEVQVLSEHRIWVWVILAVAAIVCPRLAIAMAHWGTRPLREVSDAARHVSSSTLHERLQVRANYPQEIATLAESFNAMLTRLEDSFARLSRFSSDLAHELRTPVNNIRGEAEVALGRPRTADEYRDTLGSCLEESERLTNLIESLLFLARSDNPGEHLKKESCAIGDLLSTVREYYEPSASEAHIALVVDCPREIQAAVDPQLLQRALGNLVSNAIAHTPSGGSIVLRAARQNQHLQIAVKDSGSGISPEALPKVFDRFYRSDPARPRNSGGTGLGLAIVRQIIHLHGGEVQITSQLRQGTTVSISIPA